MTTQQMRHVLQLGGFAEVEVEVPTLLDPTRASAAIEVATMAVVDGLRREDVLLRTSRHLITGSTPSESLSISRSVATSLAGIVAASVKEARPRWVIGKGGITASDIATTGLGLRRAWVIGQMLPGRVSVWAPALDGDHNQPLCVIFPGNVGGVHSLTEVVGRLRTQPSTGQC